MRLTSAIRAASGLTFLAVTLAACASAGRPTFADEGRTVVAVENQREVPMDVFIADAGRVRLGRVGPKAKAEFTIPAWFVPQAKEMEFMAMALSRQYPAYTQRIWVGPGERMELVISQ